MPKLVLQGIQKRYGPIIALEPLHLEVPDGEWLTLIGRSGAGKSTILRLVAGLESATGGRILLDDLDVTNWPAHARDVAWVPQRPALYPGRSVAENLAIGQRMRQRAIPSAAISAQELAARVDQAADLLGLTPLRDRRVEDLSGGERQRVALGRALVRRAGLWLLDEPLEHLDAPRRSQLRRDLLLLSATFRATILCVTHAPDDALSLSQHIAVLDRGRLLQVGSPQQLLTCPAHRLTADLLAGLPLTLIPGTLRPPDSHSADVPAQADQAGRSFFQADGEAGSRPGPAVALTRPRRVVLAIRPDAWRLLADEEAARTGEWVQTSRLWTAERLALGWLWYMDARDRTGWVWQTVPPPPRGTLVRFAVSETCCYWFDEATGERIDNFNRDGTLVQP